MIKTSHPSIFAVLNHKGGVGKTSTGAHMAAEAADQGLRVLIVDMDKQASMSTLLGVATDTPDSPGFNINDVLTSTKKQSRAKGLAAEAIIHSPWEGIDLLPSSLDLSGWEAVGDAGTHLLLSRSLDSKELMSSYDIIFIDCPPSLGMLTAMALDAADKALLVTEPEAPSLKGIRQTVATVGELGDSFNVSIAGIVINKLRTGTREHAERVEELRADAELSPLLIDPIIPTRTLITQAAGKSQPLTRMSAKGVTELRETYQAILTHILRGE